jgi:hypothetical protein
VENHLAAAVLAAGALGTAAFGIVEGLKVVPWLAEAGFVVVRRFLSPLQHALDAAYGPDSMRLLKAQYRGDTQELVRVIRQGVRIGLTPENAEQIAAALNVVDAQQLKRAAEEVRQGEELSNESRNVLGRFELAVDARIDASLTLAHDHYVRSAKISATVIALVIAVVVARLLGVRMLYGIIIGLAAVPLAPIAKDVVTAIRSAAEALRAKI